MPIFVKRLNKNEFDVFIGNGWNNWTRIRRNHWGVRVVGGARLSREVIHQLNERMVK
jgi:hypothetical protein